MRFAVVDRFKYLFTANNGNIFYLSDNAALKYHIVQYKAFIPTITLQFTAKKLTNQILQEKYP